jgi:integrase
MDQRWFSQILPERALAERTLERYVSECKLLREHWGDTPIEELRTEQLAAVLNELDPGPANKRRERLADILDEAIRDGLIDTNPASILRVRNTGPKKRQRLNLAQYRAIHAQAPVWLQNAMDIALLTLQRESDVLTMRFDEIKDDTLYVIQQKTRKYDTGYLSIQIDATLQPLPRPYRVAADHPRAAAEGRATGHPESPLERGQGQAFGG